MHEVSLMESMIALVEEQRRMQYFARVRVIRLEVGVLGHAEPEALRFCFDAVARGTVAEGARLDIAMIDGTGLCAACHEVVAIDDRLADCPCCGNPHVLITAGQELRLAELEVE
jgi:hydrogenase nickel incorporation protein HypA/HybF